MSALFEYRSDQIYCHHSLDERPEAERFQIHVHETPEVYCFLSGSGSFLVEGTNYPLCPGDILLMRPAETSARGRPMATWASRMKDETTYRM